MPSFFSGTISTRMCGNVYNIAFKIIDQGLGENKNSMREKNGKTVSHSAQMRYTTPRIGPIIEITIKSHDQFSAKLVKIT